MNEKQQQLTFEKGITNVPSDALCSDNTLEESLGMIYEDGEHRVIQRPVVKMTTSSNVYDVLYIHNYNDKKRYIVSVFRQTPTAGTYLGWGVVNQGVLEPSGNFGIATPSHNDFSITSVGKTLIVADSNGMHYYLWDIDNDTYKDIGDIPSPNVEFYLTDKGSRMGASHTPLYITSSNSYRGIIWEPNGTIDGWRIAEDATQQEYNDLVVGLYSKNIKVIKQKKCFCEPFFVRTALELYDGSYTHISQPILLFPSIYTNSYGVIDRYSVTLSIITYAFELHYKNKSHLEDWGDVVKDVVVFITDDISIYDTAIDQRMIQRISSPALIHNGIYRDSGTTLSTYHGNTVSENTIEGMDNYFILNQRGETSGHSTNTDHDEVINEIKARSVFYKLCGIGRNYEDVDHNIAEKIDAHTLENITTQEQLESDDYFSRSKLLPEFLYAYNSRLNIANVRRSMFEGYGFFMPYDNSTPSTYTFYVTIRTDDGTRIVRHIESNTYQKQGIWFYYPDSRATHVMIYKGQDCILDENLTEHPYLNGAYYFKGLPSDSEPETPINAVAPTYTTPDPEYLPNYIITSEVNNPFVFKAEGYYKVGTGKIKGMSTITQALSEGQFGQFPLLVFSESGIWALSVASTGFYSSIHPMSREVCNNVKSITQTDGAVFFSSDKGLMVIVGNQVKCVSEQLLGKENTTYAVANMGNFQDFLKTCYIAYDYRDSLLWIFSNNSASYCYVYSIKSGTFGKYNFHCGYVVNDYPDYLMVQGGGGKSCYSLIDRKNINLDNGDPYSGTLISRPMKLENALALKSIMQIKHMTLFTPYSVTNNNVTTTQQGTLTLRIFASNNLTDWVEISSLKSVPWKYYRFRYDFANLKATDRFAGTILITQERRTNKLR